VEVEVEVEREAEGGVRETETVVVRRRCSMTGPRLPTGSSAEPPSANCSIWHHQFDPVHCSSTLDDNTAGINLSWKK
jgi:hypothetical protein